MRRWELYETLQRRFGQRANPDTWWPIYYERTSPPHFERAITNILVIRANWDKQVAPAVCALDQAGLLKAPVLAQAPLTVIATCARPTGYQNQKANWLKTLAQFVVQHFGTEATFCAQVRREQLLELPGHGEETADRTLLYACDRLVWPVDTYCFRVLAHYHIIPAVPTTPSLKKRVALEIKQMVLQEMPHRVEDWQRLHALMQLEGQRLRREK